MKSANSSSDNDDEFEIKQGNSKAIQGTVNQWIEAEQINEIPFLDDQTEKRRRLSVLLADIKWTINLDGKVTYISPFIENCLGNDAKSVIKSIASRYLTPPSILSCLIELEELKEIMRTFKNTAIRRLLVELLPNESNIEKVEITSTTLFDSNGNIVGISGLCEFLI